MRKTYWILTLFFYKIIQKMACSQGKHILNCYVIHFFSWSEGKKICVLLFSSRHVQKFKDDFFAVTGEFKTILKMKPLHSDSWNVPSDVVQYQNRKNPFENWWSENNCSHNIWNLQIGFLKIWEEHSNSENVNLLRERQKNKTQPYIKSTGGKVQNCGS